MLKVNSTLHDLDFLVANCRLAGHKKVSAPVFWHSNVSELQGRQLKTPTEEAMKVWTKPEVREQEVGLEVTSYLPAEIDLI